MYVNQKKIKIETVATLENHGPPSSARPHFLLDLLNNNTKIVAIASPVNNNTLKPRLPLSTSNLSPV